MSLAVGHKFPDHIPSIFFFEIILQNFFFQENKSMPGFPITEAAMDWALEELLSGLQV
jgi:hypothetical protein